MHLIFANSQKRHPIGVTLLPSTIELASTLMNTGEHRSRSALFESLLNNEASRLGIPLDASNEGE